MILKEYIDSRPRGSAPDLAAALSISVTYLYQLAARQDGREPSAQLCVLIEQATNAIVRRWDLRPDDWHRIWPELIGSDGAPEVAEPLKQAEPAKEGA